MLRPRVHDLPGVGAHIESSPAARLRATADRYPRDAALAELRFKVLFSYHRRARSPSGLAGRLRARSPSGGREAPPSMREPGRRRLEVIA
jgi:hypothetical protein